jgi:hypothetical protein
VTTDKWFHFNKCSNVREDKIPDKYWYCNLCSPCNICLDETMIMQHENNEILHKLLEEISSLWKIISDLHGERTQNAKRRGQQENKNSLCPVVQRKSCRSKQETHQSLVPTSNSFILPREDMEGPQYWNQLSSPRMTVN